MCRIFRTDSQTLMPGLIGEEGVLSRTELSGKRNRFKNIKESCNWFETCGA